MDDTELTTLVARVRKILGPPEMRNEPIALEMISLLNAIDALRAELAAENAVLDAVQRTQDEIANAIAGIHPSHFSTPLARSVVLSLAAGGKVRVVGGEQIEGPEAETWRARADTAEAKLALLEAALRRILANIAELEREP